MEIIGAKKTGKKVGLFIMFCVNFGGLWEGEFGGGHGALRARGLFVGTGSKNLIV